MAEFNTAFQKTLKHEGGYVNDKVDPGGKTRWGITKRVADRFFNRDVDMKNLELLDARRIYRVKYWDVNRLDDLNSEDIAQEMFDTGVNMGVRVITIFLQRAVNVTNRNEKNYDDIKVDGRTGPNTIATANIAIGLHEKSLLKTLNILQGNRYIVKAEKNLKLERFYHGWIKRVSL